MWTTTTTTEADDGGFSFDDVTKLELENLQCCNFYQDLCSEYCFSHKISFLYLSLAAKAVLHPLLIAPSLVFKFSRVKTVCLPYHIHLLIMAINSACFFWYGPRQANLVLIAYASSEGSGEPSESYMMYQSHYTVCKPLYLRLFIYMRYFLYMMYQSHFVMCKPLYMSHFLYMMYQVIILCVKLFICVNFFICAIFFI